MSLNFFLHRQFLPWAVRYLRVLPFLLFVCIRKHSTALLSQTHLVLMSFTSELLLFIKHATKSVGSALPICSIIIVSISYLCSIFLTTTYYFHEIYPSANKGEKNIYWRTFWSHKSNRAFLFRLKFQSIVHRFYACIIYDVTYYLSLSTFGLT